MGEKLDPEELRSLLHAYRNLCGDVIARYDGFVARYVGDGILTYFGWPTAHEEDAERAVRAALDIAHTVKRASSTEVLSVHIGIATGPVVVGEPAGAGDQSKLAVGSTPNLAARLQGLAAADQIVIAASTRRLIGNAFELTDLGEHDLKGIGEPVHGWRVERALVTESRFDASHTARLTGFVGREAESMLLLERQRLAWQGEGQIVLISGEAGIGKSRLAVWLAEQVAAEPHTQLRYQCSPYRRDSTLHPFIAQLERAAGIAADEAPERKLDKLEALLAMAALRVGEIAPLFAALLSIAAGSRYPPLNLSLAQQRRQTLSALLDQMEGLARQKPVLMLFEDVHWADATSLEVLDLGMERVRQLPVLLLITLRSEFEPPWKGLSSVTSLALGRLDPGEAETLVERVAGRRKLPAEVMAQIVAKTDGVPLFIEELTKTVRESGILIADGDHYHLDGPLPPLAIPSTLQDSLMARIDRLAPVKEIAQIGAAIGREFTYALLNAVVGRDQASLRAVLAQLEEAELLSRTGAVPNARYSFKHMLVRDIAYESLLKSRRQVLHRRIAESLRDKFPSIASAEPELIAHHFTESGLYELAIGWWDQAGNFALRRSAFKEASAHLGKAIAMGDKLAQGTSAKSHASSRLRLQIAYANALITARGPGAPETTAAFGRARELIAGIEDAAERFSVDYGLWVGSFVRGELAIMQEIASAILRDCGDQPKSAEAGIAHRLNGVTNWFSGNFEEALIHLEQALTIFDPKRDRDLAFRFGQDIGVSAMAYSALVLWPFGQVERAHQLAESMAARASQCGHAATAVYGAFHTIILQIVSRSPVRAASHTETIVRLARDHGMPMWIAICGFLEPWARWHLGSNQDTSLAEMRLGVASFREVIALWVPLVETALAEVEAEAGEIEVALGTWIARIPKPIGPGSAGSKLRSIACAARFCLCAIRRILHPLRRPS